MASVPLLSHPSLDAPLAYRAGRPVSVREFLRDVHRLGACLPATRRHVVNLCTDRYRFAVGLAAALVTGRISLLPATHTPAVMGELREFAADVFCLTDDPQCPVDLPQTLYGDSPGAHVPDHGAMDTRGIGGPVGDTDAASTADPNEPVIPQLDADQLVAYIFTSGSTGTPIPHRKTWGRLVRCVRAGAQRLGLLDAQSAAYALLATVPAQHMYGFESSVLLAFLGGQALCAQRPFYPADICGALAALPRPRALITTPVHLRALLAAELPLPPVDLILSATAPLPVELARAAEQRFGTILQEIYGSTETGQIAMRRTARETQWLLWPEVSLDMRDGQTIVSGGHLEQPTPLGDVIENVGAQRFLLHGRSADLVNIAGKRSSIGYLNHQLNAIPGVLDGAFFVRDDEAGTQVTGVTRLGALVVAPQLEAAGLVARLRERIDPVFLPRPLLFVPALPRNATGKLPQEALQALLATLSERSPAGPCGQDQGTADAIFSVPSGHPCLPGHFPGNPLVPGVLLLDEALYRARQILGAGTALELGAVKFRSPARPGEPLRFEYEVLSGGGLRFRFQAQDRVVASGTVSVRTPP